MLKSYKDKTTYRLVRNGDHYAIVAPGYDIPADWDWIADHANYASAQAHGDDRMDSDRMMATI